MTKPTSESSDAVELLTTNEISSKLVVPATKGGGSDE